MPAPTPRRPLLVATTVVPLAAAALATAAPAAAAPAAPTPVAIVDGRAVLAANDPAGVAGYRAELAAGRHVSKVQFKVPKVVCPARKQVESLTGFVIVSGTVSAADPAFSYGVGSWTASCTDGVPSYSASVATSTGADQSGAVSPGDLLQVTLTTSKTETVVRLDDRTSGGVFRVTGPGLVANAIQASVQGGYDNQRFPRFDTAGFPAATVDGSPLTSLSPTAYDQVNATGDVVLSTSAMAADGGFKVTFVRQP